MFPTSSTVGASDTANSTTMIAVNSTDQTLNEDVTTPGSDKPTYIIASIIASILSIVLTVAGCIYREKLKIRLESLKSKYSSSNSKTDHCQLSVVKVDNNMGK